MDRCKSISTIGAITQGTHFVHSRDAVLQYEEGVVSVVAPLGNKG